MKPLSSFVRYIKPPQATHEPIPDVTPYITKDLATRIMLIYHICNPSLQRPSEESCLTQPFIPLSNDGLDNENRELIVNKDDVIGTYNSLEGLRFSKNQSRATQYRIVDKLGHGTFGQVFQCVELSTKRTFALKILKNKKAYFRQGLLEISTLTILNSIYDKDAKFLVKMTDHFLYSGHLCIVQELLGPNLYQVIKEARVRGMNVDTIRNITRQILEGVSLMTEAGIVHCDLKPENVLIGQNGAKVIDLGSACFQNYTLYSYIQSRHYRAPEIALGMKYSCSIDMWSVGCIVAEMFLGIPLFPANSEYDLLLRFVQTLGMIPISMLTNGPKAKKYFKQLITANGSGNYRMKEQFEFEWENACKLPGHKDYLPVKSLHDIIFKCQLRVDGPMSTQTKDALFDFLKGCFVYEPQNRYTPKQALTHPFVTGTSMKNYVLPPRDYKYFVFGHVVTAEPLEMIADTYKDDEVADLDLSRSQYYAVFMTLLKCGHIPNITIDGIFTYGSITPPQLAFGFKKGMFEEDEEDDKNEKTKKTRVLRLSGTNVVPKPQTNKTFVEELDQIKEKSKSKRASRENSAFKVIEYKQHDSPAKEVRQNSMNNLNGNTHEDGKTQRLTQSTTMTKDDVVLVPVLKKATITEKTKNTVVIPKVPSFSLEATEETTDHSDKKKRRYSWSEKVGNFFHKKEKTEKDTTKTTKRRSVGSLVDEKRLEDNEKKETDVKKKDQKKEEKKKKRQSTPSLKKDKTHER
ncbi:serine/threonine protein kinase ppk15, putative [Entamoeba invadens IP1]|uniref:Serine/threonine protein kinase ppk15, putative n=1 Tax=Entamoeba invadens IP1 TaxID=370355 RepID=A0A0A1U5Y1_ENTIV|nr:serine/threonine protein kinase ppk15, putative [Entamoeba invadens IP1]ELP89782.1 serine/threonine protein kinase ppk15, putative [Entamoeba invadens IP1]|eukprot:XP_004256553.1 serine/threonine protein kinase ppk15, putative [Entamoeba invadens IP1]